jgi:hypothetical protein
MAKEVKRRGRPPGSKNKKKEADVKQPAKKRGRPKGSKNKSKKGFGGSTSERLDRAFMIDDMFYSSVLTEDARSTFLAKYPGEESFFTVEWGRVAGEVADAIAGKYRSVFSIDDDDA